ncbi:MAG: radical SAM protein [Candidatus Firestonebacteria bacterium]
MDLIAVGEAEYACLDLLDNLRDKKEISSIRNLWLKDASGKIIKNELRCLIEDLDSLPSPDRKIYYKYSFLGKASVKQFLTGRGCPYDCTFCSNHLLRRMYEGKGKYIRRVSPEKIIEEIKTVRQKWGFRSISFTDDVFVMAPAWLDEFLPLFKKEIGVPFMCNVRVNLVTEALVVKLKANGCYGVAMGIESGNEDLRNRVLKKRISNEEIIKAGRLIKSNGLKLKAFNMLGLPGETFEQALETLEINMKIRPDFTPVALLEPYPKYEITDYAVSKGYLNKNYGLDDVAGSIYVPSKIELKDKDKIINLQSFFFLAVKFPVLLPLIKKLVNYKPNIFYKLLTKIIYGYYMSRIHRLTLGDIIRYALHIDATQV